MTSLIDADALRDKIIQRIIEEDTEFPEYDWGMGLSIAKDILDRMPIVEAIPIEWLECKLHEHAFDELWWMIDGVIKEWEKEQEEQNENS